MKIDYEDIITKANARKNALINFIAQVDALGDLMSGVDELCNRMDSLKAACEALDAEAVQMVGHHKVTALRALSGRYSGFVNGLTIPDGSGHAISKTVGELIAEAEVKGK